MEAPPGFRAIGMAQSMVEYGKPLMELEGAGEDMDKVMHASMLLWNHALSVERGEITAEDTEQVVRALGQTFGLPSIEAELLRKRMVERKSYLFPEELQPKDHRIPFMFVRKEKMIEIIPFDYERMVPSGEENTSPNTGDRALIDSITKLDNIILQGGEYADYEPLLNRLKEDAERLFGEWLSDKGFPEEFWRLAECIMIYFDFVYGYVHDKVITLNSMPAELFVEFFEDFLLRKMYAEPQEYVDWPPAIKLFYQFLEEKGYLEDSAPVLNVIGGLEPAFLNIIRKQFG
jgi:hypothetical protein